MLKDATARNEFVSTSDAMAVAEKLLTNYNNISLQDKEQLIPAGQTPEVFYRAPSTVAAIAERMTIQKKRAQIRGVRTANDTPKFKLWMQTHGTEHICVTSSFPGCTQLPNYLPSGL
jgi:hypothetical protein